MANTYTGSDTGQAGLNVTEVDGSPSVFGVTKITVSNGTLTDDGNGSVTITTGGGGGGSGTVTSVAVSGGTTGLTVTGSPITTSGTITLGGTLAVANGGTGQTTYTDGQLLIGNTTGGTLAKATLTQGTGISITNGAGSITIAATNNGTVTSVSVNGSMDETGTATDPDIGLNFTAIGPGLPSGGASGFALPPPDDTGYSQYGWILFQAADLVSGTPPLYVPAWTGP